MELIQSVKENCKLSYACIRVCPAKAIKIEDSHAQVIHERCIGCGNCVSVCKSQALIYADSTEQTYHILNNSDKVAAIIDPSIAGEFTDITSRRNFVGMIKTLGFKYVCETAFGADLVALKYKELLGNFKGKYYITTNCPSVIYYVEKYHPGTINNLAPIITPMIATSKVIHKEYGADTKIVYIGPCSAAKMEPQRISDDGNIDAVLTFTELRKMFKANDITENKVEYSDFDPPHGGKGSLFPINRGMFQSVGINDDLLTGRVINTEGRYNFIEAIKEFENLHSLKKHIDLFYCDGGCIMGPGTSKGGQKFNRRTMVIEYTKKRLEMGDKKVWMQNIKKFKDLNLHRSYTKDDQRIPPVNKSKVKEVLEHLGKTTGSDFIDCGACGYQTCAEFAKAVSNNLAESDMCMIYNIKNKQEVIKNLEIANEKLEKTRIALEESEQFAQKEKEAAKEKSDITEVMLQRIPSSVVLVDNKLRIIQANKKFIKMLGEDAEAIDEIIPGLSGADLKTLLPGNIINLFSYAINNNDDVENRDVNINGQLLNISIFPVKGNEIAGAVIRDMTTPEVQKEEVINRITEVIDKNLKMVQNIGFLLGEGASETEQMLKSIINSYKADK